MKISIQILLNLLVLSYLCLKEKENWLDLYDFKKRKRKSKIGFDVEQKK